MKSIISYISEKMLHTSKTANKNVNPDKIIELMNKQNLIFIDRYDNSLLANDIRLCGKNDGTMIDRIELNDDNTTITIFIIAPGDEEYDETFDISEWDEYITDEDTNKIYKYLLKELNL